MGLNNLPADPVRLLQLADATARRLVERREELLRQEALLRAAIAWAQGAQKAQQAAVERAKESAKDSRFVEITRKRRIRAEDHLRLRLMATIAWKCEVTKNEGLLKTADFAPALLH
jgi:hypothetical protein